MRFESDYLYIDPLAVEGAMCTFHTFEEKKLV